MTDDIVERLEFVANLKPSDPMPDDFGPNVWSVTISQICRDAAEEIKRMRNQVFGQNAKLDQLQSIVGIAMSEPLQSFADIKKVARHGS